MKRRLETWNEASEPGVDTVLPGNGYRYSHWLFAGLREYLINMDHALCFAYSYMRFLACKVTLELRIP
jgi:hypothetical protein